MKATLLLLIPILCTLCSCAQKLSAPVAIKQQSYAAALGEWQGSESPLAFGRKRSLQILNLDRLRIQEGNVAYYGDLGTATFVTADGYALTADHVIPGSGRFGTLFDKNETQVGSSYLHFTKVLARVREGNATSEAPKEVGVTTLTSYPGGRILGPDKLEVDARPLRIVKRFPSSDLALVKLPFRGVPHFELATGLVQNRLFYSSGSAFAKQTAPSAGILFQSPRRGRTTQRLLTSIPVSSGDSGGPIFDSGGGLAGIVSTGELAPTRSLKLLLHSRFAHIDPADLTALIASDRRAEGH